MLMKWALKYAVFTAIDYATVLTCYILVCPITFIEHSHVTLLILTKRRTYL